MAIDITLTKEKYRRPGKRVPARQWERGSGDRGGVTETWLYAGGRFFAKCNNSGKQQKSKQGTGHRRRSYLGAVATE